MRKALTMLVLALVLPAGAALADDDCRVPMADWQPREAVTALAQERGWTISGIKIDDGCYEVRGTDAEGHQIRVKIDPGNLDLAELRIDGGMAGNGWLAQDLANRKGPMTDGAHAPDSSKPCAPPDTGGALSFHVPPSAPPLGSPAALTAS